MWLKKKSGNCLNKIRNLWNSKGNNICIIIEIIIFCIIMWLMIVCVKKLNITDVASDDVNDVINEFFLRMKVIGIKIGKMILLIFLAALIDNCRDFYYGDNYSEKLEKLKKKLSDENSRLKAKEEITSEINCYQTKLNDFNEKKKQKFNPIITIITALVSGIFLQLIPIMWDFAECPNKRTLARFIDIFLLLLCFYSFIFLSLYIFHIIISPERKYKNRIKKLENLLE